MAKANLSVTIPDGTLFRVSMIFDSETDAKKMLLEFSEELSLASNSELRQVVFSGSFCLSLSFITSISNSVRQLRGRTLLISRL